MSAGAVGGALGAVAGPFVQWGSQAHSSHQNWNRQKALMKNAITWRVQDLRQAGLNPLLAVSGGLSGGGSPPGGLPGTGQFDIPGAMQKYAEGRRAGAQEDLTRAQEDLVGGQLEVARSQAELNRQTALRQAAEGRRASAEADWIELKRAPATMIKRLFDRGRAGSLDIEGFWPIQNELKGKRIKPKKTSDLPDFLIRGPGEDREGRKHPTPVD